MEEDQLHAASTAMAHEFSSFKQQQELEEDLDGSYRRTLQHDMDLFMDDAVRIMAEFKEKAKEIGEKANDFMQRLLQLQMRRHDIKNQYSDHRPRVEVAAEPSVQPSTINDDPPAQTHPKLRLCFNGSLNSTIYTNRSLQGQSNREIEIVICTNDQIITSGRLASLRVEIVALEKDHSCRGQWDEEDFDRQIRKSRYGQGSVLDGECVVQLVNGKASLGNIRFKEHSTGSRCRELVLAARVCKSENIRIEEAFMHPPFVVLVERSKGNEKSCLPMSTDKVYTLKGIARNGPYATRLETANIHTVGDFLKVFNEDSEKLRQILQIKMESAWNAMVKHALKCDLSHDPKLRSNLSVATKTSLNSAPTRSSTQLKKTTQKAFVDAQLEHAHSELDGMPVDYYVLENNHPVKIPTNIVAPGSSHQTTLQAEHMRPGSRIDCATAPDHAFGDANLNPACQSSSELYSLVHQNGHANQGLCHNGVPNPKGYTICHADTMGKQWTPNTMPESSSEGTFPVVGPWSRFPQACGTSNPCDYVMESNDAVPTMLGASSQSASGNQATFQAENMRPLGSGIDCVPSLSFGDANCNAVGHSASEPFRPGHFNGHVNQVLGDRICSTDPEGGVILPDSTTDDHPDMTDETWRELGLDDIVPVYSSPDYSPPERTLAQGTTTFLQDNGSAAPVDTSFWLQRQEADSTMFMSDETIYNSTCSGYNPADS